MPVKLEVEGLGSFGDGTGTLEVSEFRHVEWTTGEFRDGEFRDIFPTDLSEASCSTCLRCGRVTGTEFRGNTLT
jgi:hypothetical protein